MWKRAALVAAMILATLSGAHAQDVVRLGNLRFAHYGTISYMKELAAKYNLRIEERVFVRGVDIYPEMAADLIDIAASGGDGAVAARGNGVKLVVVAGFSDGGARVLARPELKLDSMAKAKGLKVATVRGGIQDLLLLAELDKYGLTWSERPGKDVQLLYFNSYADLNQALASKNVDVICQSEPQSTQAISAGWATEVVKPYDSPIGVPVRPLVMTEKMYTEHRDVALRVLKLFVEATLAFKNDPALAERYVRQSVFKGQLTHEDYRDAMSNASFTVDMPLGHMDRTRELMVRFDLGKMVNPPREEDWVRLDLLREAKASFGIN